MRRKISTFHVVSWNTERIAEGQYFTLFHQKRVKYSVERNVMFAVAQQIGGVLAIIITFAWLQKRAATLVTVS
jgi:hypothetical protein